MTSEIFNLTNATFSPLELHFGSPIDARSVRFQSLPDHDVIIRGAPPTRDEVREVLIASMPAETTPLLIDIIMCAIGAASRPCDP